MTGSTLWIILGVLISVVAIFLVVSTILDKKKRKKIVIEKDKQINETKSSYRKIIFFTLNLFSINQKLLDNFVPSVGKIKMVDIKNKAREALKKIKQTRDFKNIQSYDDYKDLIQNLDKLFSENSNNWIKNNLNIFFEKEAKKNSIDILSDDVEFAEMKSVLREVYLDEFTK